MYRSVAAKILNNLRSAYTHNHTWIEVNPNSFRHLSHKFYNETQKVLENLGFSFLADIENEYLKNRTPDPRTFIRVMTTRDGVINAGFYQLTFALLLNI